MTSNDNPWGGDALPPASDQSGFDGSIQWPSQPAAGYPTHDAQAGHALEHVPYEQQSPTPYGQDPNAMLLSIGDIAVYPDRVVTPSGSHSHRGLTWVVRDNTTITEGIPAYAIVLAILLFLVCFVGLFFLLIKEKKIQGYVEVSLQGDQMYHVTQIPISTTDQIQLVRQQVDYARGLANYAR